MKIVVASANAGKLREIRDILTDDEIISMSEAGFIGDIDETGDTFYQNAYLKAKTVFDFLGGKFDVLADDSGLCVNALGGAPGVFSARYACGEGSNRDKLLKNLAGVTDRSAYFYCLSLLLRTDGSIVVGEGKAFGKILNERVGENGFGYDNVFFSDSLQKSFGLATESEKNGVSHRSEALRNLKTKLNCKK